VASLLIFGQQLNSWI